MKAIHFSGRIVAFCLVTEKRGENKTWEVLFFICCGLRELLQEYSVVCFIVAFVFSFFAFIRSYILLLLARIFFSPGVSTANAWRNTGLFCSRWISFFLSPFAFGLRKNLNGKDLRYFFRFYSEFQGKFGSKKRCDEQIFFCFIFGIEKNKKNREGFSVNFSFCFSCSKACIAISLVTLPFKSVKVSWYLFVWVFASLSMCHAWWFFATCAKELLIFSVIIKLGFSNCVDTFCEVKSKRQRRKEVAFRKCVYVVSSFCRFVVFFPIF